MFVPLGIEQFVTPVFTGNTWNYVPSNRDCNFKGVTPGTRRTDEPSEEGSP
jgi:hypothetical protein